ncbi:MAG: exosortase/archaeosortase family protein [Candidatus Thermoplasmatota archaeon]|nr:exosortase/archaeosortase family protein [Candidatus Thermoplasmatota archaeon]
MDMETRINLRRWFRENRMRYFYASIFASSFLFVFSTQGFFNLFFYALLVLVIVRMSEDKYDKLPLPDIYELIFGGLIMAGSFAFDLATRDMLGGGYGQTDYTILLIGIIFTFFGYKNLRKIYLPILLVGGLMFSLQGLQLVYGSHFESIADWFVDAIVGVAGVDGLGYPVWPGSVPGWAQQYYSSITIPPGAIGTGDLVTRPGTFTVFGLNETASLHVDWGCTGLRSLVMFSFILLALIWPMEISWKKKIPGIAIGIIGAFIINILRMIMLALLMYYYDLATTMEVHKHLGDFLFIIWMAIYWFAFFHFFGPEREWDEDEENEGLEEDDAPQRIWPSKV